MLLGGNKPVQSQSSSQPFSSLYLQTDGQTQLRSSQKHGSDVSHLLYVIVCQLLEDLTEDLVFERLGLQCSFKYLIRELVDRTPPFGRVVAHILHHRCTQSRTTTITCSLSLAVTPRLTEGRHEGQT